MKQRVTTVIPKRINILLADDEKDDNLYFSRTLKSVSFLTKIKVVEDGEMLMNHFEKKQLYFPDILFLDLNTPRKNGLECLIETKANESTNEFPVIIYSTSLNKSMTQECYEKGAQHYVKKGEFNDLIKHLELILEKFANNNLNKKTKDTFILSLQ
ncbi:MAG: response regulator [Bacteroidetes bacterium]|nr:response regulator [Bacteroidota bacterium]